MKTKYVNFFSLISALRWLKTLPGKAAIKMFGVSAVQILIIGNEQIAAKGSQDQKLGSLELTINETDNVISDMTAIQMYVNNGRSADSGFNPNLFTYFQKLISILNEAESWYNLPTKRQKHIEIVLMAVQNGQNNVPKKLLTKKLTPKEIELIFDEKRAISQILGV